MKNGGLKLLSVIIWSLQFLISAVLEAKEVICDIQNSLTEQKEMLDFSAQQQEEVGTISPS